MSPDRLAAGFRAGGFPRYAAVFRREWKNDRLRCDYSGDRTPPLGLDTPGNRADRTNSRHCGAGRSKRALNRESCSYLLESIPKVKTVEVKAGGRGITVPPSMRVVGAGEEIVIECEGRRESALAFVIRTFRQFHYIFEVAPVPLNERRVQSLDELLRDG